jgi:hypothetical protein
MPNSPNGVLGKALALSLIVIVTVTSCPMVTQVPSNSVLGSQEIIWNAPGIPDTPLPDPVEVAVPAFFYLDGKTPTMQDTGRTGFMVAYMEAAENLVVVSDDREREDHPVVYFYGIEGISRVEIHFAPNANFPSRFVIRQEGLPSTTGDLSPYNEATETFSLTLSGDPAVEPYDNLVLNKSLFDAYPVQGDLTDSQYLRVKNILTSLALWTAIAYQTENMAPAIAGESVATVLASAVEVVACPPAMLAATSTTVVITPVVTPVQVTIATVSIASMAGAIAVTIPPDEDTPSTPAEPPPPPITIATGDRGPADGILASKLEGTDDWIEVAPEDIGSFRIIGGEAEKACTEYSVTVDGTKIDGWYLPSSGELEFIYKYLYKEGKIDCQSKFYWSSTRANSTGIYYISVDFFNGQLDGVNGRNEYLVRPVRRVSQDEIVAFKKAQGNG